MAPRDKYYDRLGDKALAAVFEEVTKGNPKARVGKEGAQKIMDALLKDDAINGFDSPGHNEASTIDMLIYDAKFDDAALELIAKRLQEAIHLKGALTKGIRPILPNSTTMTAFSDALGPGNVGKISFASPGTKIFYSPSQFATVKAMLDNGDIKVYQPELGAFRNNPLLGGLEGGSYASDSNQMIIHSAFDRVEDQMTIVHEATHTIQDWLDIKSTVRFCEGDAYVAGALAAIAMGWKKKNFKQDSPYIAAIDGAPKKGIESAVKIVLAGKANDPNNAAWKKSYTLVTDAVAKDNLYRKRIDDVSPGAADKLYQGQTPEADRFKAMLSRIKP